MKQITGKKSTARVVNMTEGNPMRIILMFAVPLFIGNIFQQVYSMIDTMIAGYSLGDGAIAAIGATSSLYSLLINIASGLNSGYAIVVTQYFGSGNEKKLKEAVAGMIQLNIVVTAVLTVVSVVFLRPLMRFMNTPEAIFSEAYRYIVVICMGMLATICYNMFSGILRAVGNSRTSIYFLILASLLNIGLDLLFVVGLKMGVAGAALATVIAQGTAAAFCGWYIVKNYRFLLPSRKDLRVSKKLLGELVSQGVAMGLMLCVVDLGSILFQRATNGLGASIISAQTASRRIIGITMQPLATIATASSTFVGQNWGAGKTDRIRSGLKQVLKMEMVWSGIACIIAAFFGDILIRITTGTEDLMIIQNAVMNLRWHLFFFPVLGALLVLRTAMQAMGKKIAPIISSCLELGMKGVSAAFLIPQLGFFGSSITEPLTWVIMLVFLVGAFCIQKRALFGESRWKENLEI
ncbi:MAG: MATE family efflux transporter [Lachnospiraceae bacterium]|jgi:putative MATE family efflux protein|nr:MATE family efflux transporter [Lachnospiraceae bacterium]